MKKLPSLGFVYLCIVTIGAILFFTWVISERWYDRINTPEQTDRDLKKYVFYLESIVDDFLDKAAQEEILLKIGTIWTDFQNKQKARTAYKRLNKMFPENKKYSAKLISLLPSDDKYKHETGKKLYKQGYVDESILNIMLYLLANGDNDLIKDEILNLVYSNNYDGYADFKYNKNIVFCNLSPDGWATNQDPFIIIIKNSENKNMTLNIELACFPKTKYLPVVTKIKGINFKKEFIFDKDHQNLPVSINVPPGETIILSGNTDKTWRYPNDPRALGVNVKFIDIVYEGQNL